MSQEDTLSPKVFISYSWSSPEHEAWVIQLATDIEESGAHVLIDKWDLREGADKYAFMEKIVTDKSVRKVIVVCDRLYAEKADGREGGVGTETQIISQEIYNQIDPADQVQKFVAVISEKDENGKAYVPTFFKSRIYIDMSDHTLRTDNYEQLLRWIFDKPLHKRPERGKPPAYLFEERDINLGTNSRHKQAVDYIKQNKETALGVCQDFFDTFVEHFSNFNLEAEEGKEFDDQVIENIETFLPYRDQVIDICFTIAKYNRSNDYSELIHRFLERILPYGYWPPGLSSWNQIRADNYKFILNEIFLYIIAAFLKAGWFEIVNDLLGQQYYFKPDSPEAPENRMTPFTYFNGHPRSFGHRNKRLNLNRLSLIADVLKERSKRYDLPFIDIMQADFVLFLRAELRQTKDDISRYNWWPHTLVYASWRHTSPFEIFARSESKRYFENLKLVLGIKDKSALVGLLKDFQEGKRRVPRWDFDSFNSGSLINIEKLATEE